MNKAIKPCENSFSREFLSSMKRNRLPVHAGDVFVSAELAAVIREKISEGTLPEAMLHIAITIYESNQFPFSFEGSFIHGFFLDFEGHPQLILLEEADES